MNDLKRMRGEPSWGNILSSLVGMWAARIGMLFLQAVILAWLWNSYVVAWYGVKFSLPVVPYNHVFVIGLVWIMLVNIIWSARK